MRNVKIVFLMMIALFITSHVKAASQSRMIAGPVSAHVLEVIDGDTLYVEAEIWLGHSIKTFIRVDGIDTAEKRSKCDHEKALALKATNFVKEQVKDAPIILTNIRYGKYAGRVIADVTTPNNEKLSDLLFNQQLARKYTGGKRQSWCS